MIDKTRIDQHLEPDTITEKSFSEEIKQDQETITDQETDSLTREKQRDHKRNIDTTQCDELTPKRWKRRRKAREVLNVNHEKRWSDLRKIDEDDPNDFKPNKIITRSQSLKMNFEIKGNRIVDSAQHP